MLFFLFLFLDKRRKYQIYMVPRCLHVCEMVLEQEGVIGLVQIEDLHIDFLPLDNDLISLENPDLLKSVFMVNDIILIYCKLQ